MVQSVKISALLLLILGSFSSSMASPNLVEQWFTRSIERRQWREPLSEPSRNARDFNAVEEARERANTAHRISDGILRNTLQDLVLVSAPKTAATVKEFTEQVSNRSTIISNNTEDRAEVRYGYSLFEDTARAEYLASTRRFGVQFENVMVWDDPRRIMRVRCFGEQKLDARGTTAHASYYSADRTITLALSGPLSRTVSARFELISLHRGGTAVGFQQAGVTLVVENASL